MTTKHAKHDIHACACPTCHQHPYGSLAREHRRLNRLVAATDERTRRLLVALLAHNYGFGGIAHFARITGLDPKTIARGRRELQRGHLRSSRRLRRPGAGQPRAEKKAHAS